MGSCGTIRLVLIIYRKNRRQGHSIGAFVCLSMSSLMSLRWGLLTTMDTKIELEDLYYF